VSDKSLDQLLDTWRGIIEIDPSGDVTVMDKARLRSEVIDSLVRQAVFSASADDKRRARAMIREAARQTGVLPASIQPLYDALGRQEVKGFTTPAINVRGMAYDMARAIISTIRRNDVGAFILELARSEGGYTHQPPGEYATVMMAAAVREGFEGPLFIQGDHYQVNAKKFAQGGETRAAEIQSIKDLIAEAIAAGYGNIDIDASTVVDLSKTTVKEQQRDNFTTSAELAAHVRSLEPEGMTVSIGGEIGEVGGRNSTPEELRAYMDGFLEELGARAPSGRSLRGPSKISIQTGTTHGGVPLPDGTLAKVKIDFEVMKEISAIARKEYGMAGAVQHGASTLPLEAFDHFPQNGAAEVHLATDFQNILMEHEVFPRGLRDEMYAYLEKTYAAERKPDMTPEQFYYKTRKKAWGPFKEQVWGLPAGVREELRAALEKRFDILFHKLNVIGTASMVRGLVRGLDVKSTV